MGRQANPGGALDAIDAVMVLERCIERHTGARTIQCAGTLTDHRDDAAPSPRRLEILLERPDRCRIELDRDVTIVQGRAIWTYDSLRDRFGNYRAFTTTPARTAGEIATGGVSLLPIDLFERGARALGSGDRGPGAWRLREMDFCGGRPCYVVDSIPAGGRGRLALWIDQDEFVLRRWRLYSGGGARTEQAILTVTFDRVALDAPLDSSSFLLRRTTAGERRR